MSGGLFIILAVGNVLANFIYVGLEQLRRKPYSYFDALGKSVVYLILLGIIYLIFR